MAKLEPLLEVRRYRLGQTLMRPDVMPEGLLFWFAARCAALGLTRGTGVSSTAASGSCMAGRGCCGDNLASICAYRKWRPCYFP